MATEWRRPVSRWQVAHGLLVLALAVAGLAGGPALAQSPAERAEYANVEFRLPDKWSVETGKQKLTLVAPNEDGFIQFSTLQPGNDGQLRAQAAQALTAYLSDTVLADPGDPILINGMPGFRVSGSGASDATAVQFVAVALSPTPAKPILVLAYASLDSFATHAPVFETLIKSLKRR
ncbi:MAG: hypothetical protein K0S54_1056 [Alphaproteobacteria bacterium]|nr:hypothetical protein [Alphaproteobacteria bacterium]